MMTKYLLDLGFPSESIIEMHRSATGNHEYMTNAMFG
jgi:hypothetical protein